MRHFIFEVKFDILFLGPWTVSVSLSRSSFSDLSMCACLCVCVCVQVMQRAVAEPSRAAARARSLDAAGRAGHASEGATVQDRLHKNTKVSSRFFFNFIFSEHAISIISICYFLKPPFSFTSDCRVDGKFLRFSVTNQTTIYRLQFLILSLF